MLTIETGAGVAGADSYASLADLAARASEYGETIPTGDPEREVLLRRAAEQMNPLPWAGERVSPSQALAWPRCGVPGVASDAVPLAVRYAQCALATELYRDDLDPPAERRGAVVRERVDVLEVEYAAAAAPPARLSPPCVLWGPYMRASGVRRA